MSNKGKNDFDKVLSAFNNNKPDTLRDIFINGMWGTDDFYYFGLYVSSLDYDIDDYLTIMKYYAGG
jgi:hypothetical protein